MNCDKHKDTLQNSVTTKTVEMDLRSSTKKPRIAQYHRYTTNQEQTKTQTT